MYSNPLWLNLRNNNGMLHFNHKSNQKNCCLYLRYCCQFCMGINNPHKHFLVPKFSIKITNELIDENRLKLRTIQLHIHCFFFVITRIILFLGTESVDINWMKMYSMSSSSVSKVFRFSRLIRRSKQVVRMILGWKVACLWRIFNILSCHVTCPIVPRTK